MNKQLEREINGIEHLDEMNETINMYKEKKTSALELAAKNGTVESIEQLKRGDPFDVVLKRSKFKLKKDLVSSVAVVMVNEVANALKKPMPSANIVTVQAVLSKSKQCTEEVRSKYSNYERFKRQLGDIKSFQLMAIQRGESQKALKVTWEIGGREWVQIERRFRDEIVDHFGRIFLKTPFHNALRDEFETKLGAYFKRKLKAEAKVTAETESIAIFGSNLRSLLLTQPVKIRDAIMSIDPGFANGCKCAIVKSTGKVLDTFKVNLRNEASFTRTVQDKLIDFRVEKVCVGDGCGSKEAEELVGQVLSRTNNVTMCRIREAGASVYSCSPVGIRDLPDCSPGERGAITLARRVINPLQELVKVEPRSLGIGQYQHNLSP